MFTRGPIDHVHGPVHGLDAEPVQKLLEGLTFQASRIKRLRPTSDCRCAAEMVAELLRSASADFLSSPCH
jgi:hypothetical protein